MVLILKCELHDDCTVYHDVHQRKGKPAPIDTEAVAELEQKMKARLAKMEDALSEAFARIHVLEEMAK